MRLLRRLWSRVEGQDLAEYSLALGVIAAATVVAANVIRGPIQALWENAQAAIGQ